MKPILSLSTAMLLSVVLLPSCRLEPKIAEGTSAVKDLTATQTVEQDPMLAKFSGYRKWHRVNDKPHQMSDIVMLYCRLLSPEEAELARKQDPNIHGMKEGRKTFTVFVNDLGKERLLRANGKAFPIGTILVKEKHKGSDADTSELLTVMVKREKGFAPKDGDWQYLVLKGFAKSIQKGESASCIACHASAKDNDYVFADYLPKR